MNSIDLHKKFMRLVFSARRVMAAKGVLGLVSMAGRRFLHLSVISEPRTTKHPFDVRYGTQTSGLVDLSIYSDQFAYYGISPSVFRQACARWIATLSSPVDLEKYSFVDLGSGSGRALLLASEFSFREVIGVELNDSLVACAQKNIEIWNAGRHSHTPIRVECADVRAFHFPPSPVLIFLYNPFGENTMLEIIARLQKFYSSPSSSVDILYCYPKHGYLFDEAEAFHETWMAPIALDTGDREADAFHNQVEVCAGYRLSKTNAER